MFYRSAFNYSAALLMIFSLNIKAPRIWIYLLYCSILAMAHTKTSQS